MKKRLLEVFILIITAVVILALYDPYPPEKEDYRLAEVTVPSLDINMEYGIVLDSLLIFKNKVKRNEFLAEILMDYNVDYSKINQLDQIPEEKFNVRRIKEGNAYSVIYTNDTLKELCYFVYEDSPTSYIVVDLRDSIHVHKGKKEVQSVLTRSSGYVETSLWNAMVDNNTDPNLANELSEIYAWVIDFFGIQKGDFYKLLYDKLMVEDKYIGYGKVIAALFHHNGYDFYAFYFVQDSVGDYFDEQGQSLRRTFLKAPLRFRRISSRFSYRRLHPILKIYRPHTGVDYAADYGTPVHSVGEGVVTKKGWTSQGGRRIQIKHNGTYSTAYLHLSAYGKEIYVGARVKQGDVIGYVGQSGLATGPHLDFRFYKNGQPVDPLKVKSPPTKPIDSAYQAAFQKYVDKMMAELNDIEIKRPV